MRGFHLLLSQGPLRGVSHPPGEGGGELRGAGGAGWGGGQGDGVGVEEEEEGVGSGPAMKMHGGSEWYPSLCPQHAPPAPLSHLITHVPPEAPEAAIKRRPWSCYPASKTDGRTCSLGSDRHPHGLEGGAVCVLPSQVSTSAQLLFLPCSLVPAAAAWPVTAPPCPPVGSAPSCHPHCPPWGCACRGWLETWRAGTLD